MKINPTSTPPPTVQSVTVNYEDANGESQFRQFNNIVEAVAFVYGCDRHKAGNLLQPVACWQVFEDEAQ